MMLSKYLNFVMLKEEKDFQIHHIKEVNSHFQMKNQIYYRLVVSRMKNIYG
jgi:hypothetical protein